MYCGKFLTFVALFCAVTGMDLPANFPKCKRSESDLNGCLKRAIQDVLPKLEKGHPEFRIPPLQPLQVATVTIAAGENAVHVVQRFRNVKIYGITLAKIKNVNAQIKETEFDVSIDASLAEVKIEADYELNGRILVLPIFGAGPSITVFKDLKAQLAIHSKEFIRRKQSYFEITDLKIQLTPGSIKFNFMNLFNGDAFLGTEMNDLLNEHWREIWNDVRASYERTLQMMLKNIANLIFKKVPREKLFPL